MNRQLQEDILYELMHVIIADRKIMELVSPHIKYQFMPSEELKEIFKIVQNEFKLNNKLASYGVITERLGNNEDAKDILSRIKETKVKETIDSILDYLEEFIRKSEFVILNKEIAELWKEEKHDQAITKLADRSKQINEFKLKGGQYTRLYQDFDERNDRRQNQEESIERIPTGLPQFDFATKGGVEKGTALLGIARSGVGKSTELRWNGYSATKRGYKGVHFQAEGKRAQVEDAYDAMWTGTPVAKMKLGEIDPKKWEKIRRAQSQMQDMRSEIYIVTYDQFDTATMAQCRQTIMDLVAQVGPLDFAIWDYLELFDPGDGKFYSTSAEGERFRKQAVARKMINICIEFNLAGFTMTQASSIPKGSGKSDKNNIGWNDPEFVITREHISNLKAAIDPFAYCITLNQTDDEYEANVLRVWIEKFRDHKMFNRLFRIYQNREEGKFVDMDKTQKLFWDSTDNKPRSIDNYSELIDLLKMMNDTKGEPDKEPS